MDHEPLRPSDEDEFDEIRGAEIAQQEQALSYFQAAYDHQMRGDLAAAERLYRKSIEIHPSSEAFTFLGWTMSFMGRLEDAIAYCKEAIRLDPDYGNPYNDIGAYLIELGQYRDAVLYLQQAINAPRYEARHYPHFNLGRALEQLGDWPEALREYRHALELAPGYRLAERHVSRLQARLN